MGWANPAARRGHRLLPEPAPTATSEALATSRVQRYDFLKALTQVKHKSLVHSIRSSREGQLQLLLLNSEANRIRKIQKD